jgi:F-type H+-transporting ATPase subunit b
LIDVNFTLIVQLVNFLILLVILNFLLFKPILRVLDERERFVNESREMQDRIDKVVGENMAEYDSKIIDAKQEAMSLRAAGRSEALERFREIVQSAREVNTKELEKAKESLAIQTADSREVLAEDAKTLGRDIASRLIGRTVGSKS